MKGIAALGGLTALLLLPQTPATPSAATAAEGFGADTPGGRGGRAIAVSTLADATTTAPSRAR